MKKVFTIFSLLLMGVAVQLNAQTTPVSPSNTPGTNATFTPAPTKTATAGTVKFEKTVHDFGQLEYNADGSYTFKFKNAGTEPIVIKNVQATCGCTTPSYSKEPILPGKTGTVTARYDTTRVGSFTKTLTVNVNDENIILTIKGNVGAKPADEVPAGQ